MRAARAVSLLAIAAGLWAAESDARTIDRGRYLFTHVFTAGEGLGGRPLRDAPPVRRFAACSDCHRPPRDGEDPALHGGTLPPRRTPSLAGIGLVEELADGLRRRLLTLADRDRDGVITAMEAADRRAVLAVDPGRRGSPVVDLGRFDDADGDGRPDLNPAWTVWYLDAAGRRIAGADSLRGPGVVGYAVALSAFGQGEPWPRRAVVGTSLRAVIVGAFAHHAGLQADDPLLAREPLVDGWAETSPWGAPQVYAGPPPDPGVIRDAAGRSRDDPDGDGIAAELSATEIDAVEGFLHALPPPRAGPDALAASGRRIFDAIGCVRCHVADWSLTCHRVIRGIYSDLAYHDLGPGFHERQANGSLITAFRTAPLWNLAATVVYGHDGGSADIDAVIRRHGGEAQAATVAYRALPTAERGELIGFLRRLGGP